MHWTYKAIDDPSSDLWQGDLLQPTEELGIILKAVHPHFADPKYIGFIVLTQSCDLVRRENPPECSTRHVSIAAVRALSESLPQLLDATCEPLAPGYYPEDSRAKAEHFLQRLLNQNEQAMGLFYLHPCDEFHLGTPSVAFLRVAVALRSREHYAALLRARCGRLREEFRAKLGWLTGNLFSRVATCDWHETKVQEGELQRMIRAHLGGRTESEPDASSEFLWVNRSTWREAERNCPELRSSSRPDLLRTLRQYTPPPKKEQCVKRVIEVLQELLPLEQRLAEESVKKLKTRLLNDPDLSRLIPGR